MQKAEPREDDYSVDFPVNSRPSTESQVWTYLDIEGVVKRRFQYSKDLKLEGKLWKKGQEKSK